MANAPADGYTLVGGPASLFTILPAQKDKLPRDVSRGFAQVGMIVGSGIMFIAVTPKLGVSTFPEFVALAKSRPGQIAIGTNGAGTLPHFSGLVLEKKGGVPVTVVSGGRGRHRPLRRGRSSCRHRLDARAVSGRRTDAAFQASSTKAQSRNSGYSLIAANPSGAMLRHGGTGRARCASVTPYRIEGNSAGLGIPVAVYLTVFGLLALWFYSLFQPQYIHNPGLTAYKPPPATVIAEMGHLALASTELAGKSH